MKKRLYALAVTLLLLLLTAGCAENVQLIETDSGFFGESKKPEPISIPPDAELVEVTPTPQAEEAGRLVYLILPTETGLSLREKEIITETLGASDITVEVRTHEYEAETQSQLFLEAIEAGADLILCDNADPDTTVADVTAAYEAEVPVILMNRGTMSIGSASGQLVTDRFSCMGKLIEVFAKREEGYSRYALLCDRSNMEDSDSADSDSAARAVPSRGHTAAATSARRSSSLSRKSLPASRRKSKSTGTRHVLTAAEKARRTLPTYRPALTATAQARNSAWSTASSAGQSPILHAPTAAAQVR